MKHKIVVTALTALATIGITFVSCSKDNEGYEERDARLSISVNTAEMPKTKALIEETTLPEGSKIGVSLKNLDEIGRACVGKECRSRWSPYH